jgi:hypothetical protein
MTKPLTPQSIHPESLAQMRKRGGRWAAFENHDLSSSNPGHLQFIKYGPGCTHETPPKRCPDTDAGLGWRYVPVGFVDLATGTIVETEPA